MLSRLFSKNIKINQFKKICTICDAYGRECIKQVIYHDTKINTLELIDLNPCVECIHFRKIKYNKTFELLSTNNENIGKCKLFKMKNRESTDTLVTRYFNHLCGPCGKFYEKRE